VPRRWRCSVTSCDRGVFTNQIVGYIPADELGHLTLPVRANHTIEDWYVATPDGQGGCSRDLDATLITSGGPETYACFALTIITNQTSYTLQAPGTGVARLGNKAGAYTAPSLVYFAMEKLTTPGCDAPLGEDVLYVINYHL
jgi:hypothetical protein